MKSSGAERLLPWMVIALPLMIVAFSAVLMTWYFSQRLSYYASVQNTRDFQSFVERAQLQNTIRTADLMTLIGYRESQRENAMRRTLKERVDVAFETARYLHDQYVGIVDEMTLKSLIRDALSQMVWEGRHHYIWITDYAGTNILAGNTPLQAKNLFDYRDADGRYIIREEIELARSAGEGFLETRFVSKEDAQLLYLKNFGKFDWFFGSAMSENDSKATLQQQMIAMIENVLWEPDTFVILLDREGNELVRSRSSTRTAERIRPESVARIGDNVWVRQGDLFLIRQHVGTYGWQIVSGFDVNKYMAAFEGRTEALMAGIAAEKRTIIEAAVVIAVAVALIALLLSRRIIGIFARYREQVNVREKALREFNATLEKRVEAGIEKQRQSEKMLIQQSKMAAMGDMISMIAHQWRQPLNQLSYILMNIEGAFEHGELDKKYLKEKLGDGERTLEYMSHTIDDFRHFFRPDNAREPVQVSELIDHTLRLVSKSFDSYHITITTDYQCGMHLPLFRNELIQVIINVLHNAKDALLQRRIQLPRISVTCYETGQFVVIRICDNAGGVDAALSDRIFDPYFSTKTERNGTGLGLYMSRTIIEEHFNGEISFENVGEGACFFIRIGRRQPTEETR